MPLLTDAWAELSPCRTYRYTLGRRVNTCDGRVVFVLLNPSRADETQTDPTLTRCVGFARSWGFGVVVLVNLFALRSTDPAQLWKASDPIGPDNNDAIARCARAASLIVCGWGSQSKATARASAVEALLREHGPIHHLGRNADGSPKHPLYLPANREPILWTEHQEISA